jgi:hypothetical protein
MSASNITRNSMTITFGTSLGADGYELEYSNTGVNGPWGGVGRATTTTRNVTGLPANTDIHFRVRAYNSAGNSAWSGVSRAFRTLP